MPIRTRTRYPGDIDPDLGQTIPLINLPYWVSGRYYEACFPIASGTTITSLAGSNWLTTPFLVPNFVTATAIGVEVTSAATAGNTMRLAIYNSDPITSWPTTLKLDSGTIAIDATGFKSATISLILAPGLYWASHVASAAASYRTYASATMIQFLPVSDLNSPSATYAPGLIISNVGTGTHANGYPNNFYIVANNVNAVNAQSGIAVPRILIGV